MTPTFQIRWLVDREHVATSYEAIARDIAERADRAGIARQPHVTMAVIRQRQNRIDYRWVMGNH